MTRMKSPPMTPAAIRGVLPTKIEKKKSMKREKTEERKKWLCLSEYHKSTHM